MVIRTNGGDTKLLINAPHDEVFHYGSATEVIINSVKPSSYHEQGVTTFLEVKNGHVVIDGTVYGLHLLETNGKFDNISIDSSEAEIVPHFSRDNVTVSEQGTLLCQLTYNSESKYVFLKGNGEITEAWISDTSNIEDAVLITPESPLYNSVDELANVLVDGQYVPKKTLEDARNDAIINSTKDPSDESSILVNSKAAFVALPNLGYTTKTVKILADIDMSGTAWTPLGASDDIDITIEGNNHTIKGLSNSLVYRTGNVKIADLTIEMAMPEENVPLYSAAFVAYAYHQTGATSGDSKKIVLSNCHALGTIRATNTAGGLLGYISAVASTAPTTLQVSDCTVDATILSDYRAGGVLGHCSYLKNDSLINRVSVAGSISSTGTSGEGRKAAGALIGFVAGGTDLNILDCEINTAPVCEFTAKYGEFTAVTEDGKTVIGICDPALNNATNDHKAKLYDNLVWKKDGISRPSAKLITLIQASVMHRGYSVSVDLEAGFGIHTKEKLDDILLDTVTDIDKHHSENWEDWWFDKHSVTQIESIRVHFNADELDQITKYSPFTNLNGERLDKSLKAVDSNQPQYEEINWN